MTRLPATVWMALAATCFFVALSAAAWRQGHARELMRMREALRIEIALEREAGADLDQRVRFLISRPRVLAEGHERLGLRIPDDTQVIHLPGAD